MKNAIVSCLVALVACISIPTGVTATPGVSSTVRNDEYCPYRVVVDTVIRSGPGVQHGVTGSLAEGQIVDALRRARNGYNQLSGGGWVSTSDIELVNEPQRCNG